ncbi:unnamed protein product, partial [Musa textilis]
CHRPAWGGSTAQVIFSTVVSIENSAETGPNEVRIGLNLVYRINT